MQSEEPEEQRELTLQELSDRLSGRQRLFAKEYIIDLNQTQACIRAGYSPKSAAVSGSELIRNPKVVAYIDALRNDLMSATGITATKVLLELKKSAFSGMEEYLDNWNEMKEWEDLSNDAKSNLSEVTITRQVNEDGSRTVERIQFKRINKNDSLKEISKIMGFHAPTKTENKVEGNINHTADVGLDEYL